MPPRLRTLLLFACLSALACLLPTGALAAKSGSNATATTGGVSPDDPRYRPPKRAKIINGVAYAPKGAPADVVAVINAGNAIVRKPYRYGGGHASFEDTAYDCSGSISYALHGGDFLAAPLDSSSFMRWGVAGKGKWITVWTNPGHAFLQVAGIRLDTGFPNGNPRGTHPGSGPRWRKMRSTRGFTARHPRGF